MPRFVMKHPMRFLSLVDDMANGLTLVLDVDKNITIYPTDAEALPDFLVLESDSKPNDIPEYGIEWIEQVLH